MFHQNKMGNSASFSYRPAVDTILRLAQSQLGREARVVLVLDQDSDVFVLLANIQSQSDSNFQWFKVQGQTGVVTRMFTKEICGFATRSRPVSKNVAFLGELSRHTPVPTLADMDEFVMDCIKLNGYFQQSRSVEQ